MREYKRLFSKRCPLAGAHTQGSATQFPVAALVLSNLSTQTAEKSPAHRSIRAVKYKTDWMSDSRRSCSSCSTSLRRYDCTPQLCPCRTCIFVLTVGKCGLLHANFNVDLPDRVRSCRRAFCLPEECLRGSRTRELKLYSSSVHVHFQSPVHLSTFA